MVGRERWLQTRNRLFVDALPGFLRPVFSHAWKSSRNHCSHWIRNKPNHIGNAVRVRKTAFLTCDVHHLIIHVLDAGSCDIRRISICVRGCLQAQEIQMETGSNMRLYLAGYRPPITSLGIVIKFRHNGQRTRSSVRLISNYNLK